MGKKYMLEIYSPNSIEDVEAVFESDTPFMSINVGDILNNKLWKTSSTKGLLKVIKLEHFIWEGQGVIKHKIGIITSEIDDNQEERFNT